MFQTLKNAWKTQELKTKLLFTLLIVILYRVGCCIPVPWVDSAAVSMFFGESFGAMQLMMGDAFSQANLFALSVSPYITSSIIIQLLTVAIPALERMAKDGEEGKKKIAMITRIVTMVLALVTSIGYSLTVVNSGMANLGSTNQVFAIAVMTACFCAGAAIVMWLAEKINEFGIGNGISIILFANIIARLPDVFVNFKTVLLGNWQMFGDPIGGVIGAVVTFINQEEVNQEALQSSIISLIINLVWILIVVAFLAGIVWLVVWFTDSERRIPVQYAKRVVGRKMYGGQSSNLPLKLNMAGVMPVIFANSIVSIPGTLKMVFQNTDWIVMLADDYFSYTKPLYVLVSIILLFAFAYFYIMISFNPVEVSNNIRNNGGAVPGIRPGKPTSDYIKKILNRITFIGAVFLCVVSEIPKLIISAFYTVVDLNSITLGENPVLSAIADFSGLANGGLAASSSFITVAFAGTSILIVVGVILETVRELEAQLTMRNYKGFLD